MENAVLCYRTPSFRVYSRKPAKPKKNEKKEKEEKPLDKKPTEKSKKRAREDDDLEKGDTKRLKTNNNDSMKQFSEKVLELFSFCKNLDENEKKQAKTMMSGLMNGL